MTTPAFQVIVLVRWSISSRLPSQTRLNASSLSKKSLL